MIAIRLQGRLGNQLFQYAFIYAAAKKIKTEFYIDQFIQKSILHEYFQLEITLIDRVNKLSFSIADNKNILNIHIRKNFNRLLANIHQLKIRAYAFDQDGPSVELTNRSLYLGYFQSRFFLNGLENSIRGKFILKKQFIAAFDQKYGELYLNKTIVTIHIRRTDYRNLGHLNLGGDDLSLPLIYFQNALSAIKGENLHYIFISDDHKFVEDNFMEVIPKTISCDTEIYDFQHLLNASYCIISNSTFSWWGAWLNAQPNKVVYCPKYYLGYHLKKQIPANIYPEEWRQIEFD